jgi:glycosyltransferase involved in cell wall biosynthesis
MRQNDVLIFPSLFEGFGLVITEAMSQGMPVITTDRTAGPDLIKNGETGWLIEAGSTEALRWCIEDILTKPELIIQAGRLALEQANKRTWEVYGQELTQAILAI